MSHSDDDGLVVPPRLAPAQVVILPIYRDDSQRADVLKYVEKVKEELAAQHYAGSPIRVEIDDRDIRGGEKKWHHVKRGVPIRLEIGPKDIEKDAVFLGRRDQPKSAPMGRGELIAGISSLLAEMQQGLFDAAAKLRDDNSCVITMNRIFVTSSHRPMNKIFTVDLPIATFHLRMNFSLY